MKTKETQLVEGGLLPGGDYDVLVPCPTIRMRGENRVLSGRLHLSDSPRTLTRTDTPSKKKEPFWSDPSILTRLPRVGSMLSSLY